jgi:transposase-like protein
MTSLSEARFHNETAAIRHIEASRWPNGEVHCPHCGSLSVHRMAGKTQAGMFLCNDCRDKFTCRTGTVMERSHIPLHKWLLAIHLMTTSKKGISAHQLFRNLGFGSYRTAWFLAHRIREAMTDDVATSGPLGGAGKTVEVDETVVGGKKPNRAYGEPAPKKIVLALIERDGRARSFHVANVTAKKLRPIVMRNVSRKSTLHTDEAAYYVRMGREFAEHKAVDHSRLEYAYKYDGRTVSTNTAENYFSILKRGIYGVYHSVSEAHLSRYLAEFDFRYSNRSALGIEDAERAAKALKGIEGKRLTYNQPTALRGPKIRFGSHQESLEGRAIQGRESDGRGTNPRPLCLLNRPRHCDPSYISILSGLSRHLFNRAYSLSNSSTHSPMFVAIGSLQNSLT